MAFQLTTATSRDDICQQIVAFAVANAGFTNAGSTTVSAKTVYRLSKGGIHFHFGDYTSAGWIRMQMGYALVAGAWPTSANGQEYPTYMSTQAFNGPYTNLFMFTDGTAVHVVVELTNGIYNHLSFGSVTKLETFTGGEYMCAGYYSYISSSLYQPYHTLSSGNWPPFTGYSGTAPATSHTPYMRNIEGTQYNDMRDFAPIGGSRTYTSGPTQRCMMSGPAGGNVYGSSWCSMNDALIMDEPNAGTLRSPMHPNYVFTYNSVTGLWRLSGHIPNMRVLNMASIDEKELIYTDWQVFPLTQRNGSRISIPSSNQDALAYRRV